MSAAEADTKPEPGFEAIITADRLEPALEAVSTIVDECKIRLSEDGLTIRAVDPSNVGMCRVSVDADAFESFRAQAGVIGVNLERLEDVVGMADGGELVHLALDPATRKLEIAVGKLSYTLSLIDPDSIRQEPDLPDLELPARVVCEGRVISQAVSAADLCSDHISLGCDEDAAVFYAEAMGDTDDVRIDLGRDDVIELEPGAAHSLFSLDYLDDMEAAIDSGAEVALNIGEEFPVRMAFERADSHVSVVFMLAPRISSE